MLIGKSRFVHFIVMLGILLEIFPPGAIASASLELPDPGGKYGVGTTRMALTDSSRKEEITRDIPDDYREMVVQIWYPTDADISGETTPYMDNITGALVSDSEMPPGVPADFYQQIKTHSMKDAPVAGRAETFPVLIFSPGLGVFCSAYQSLMEEIVSHGYVVAGIDHPYFSGITAFPDGRVIEAYETEDVDFFHNGFPMVVDDMKFVLQELARINSGVSGHLLSGRLDLSNPGFFGHSFGGAAAVQSCMETAQCGGAVDIDGSMWGEDYKNSVDVPVLLILSEPHTIDFSLTTLWENLKGDGYRIRIEGTDHNTFTDMGWLLRGFFPDISLEEFELGSIDPGRGYEITNGYIIAFFDSFLRGESGERITALNYPEVIFEVAGESAFDGLWRSRGYGWMLVISGVNVSVNAVTSVNMMPVFEGTLDGDRFFVDGEFVGTLSLSGTNLVAEGIGGISLIFDPLDQMPSFQIVGETKDPVANFEAFWRTFEEHFSLFTLTGVDWHALYDQYRPQVTANTSDEELFDILSAMIKPLNDAHTVIVDEVNKRVAQSGPESRPLWTEREEELLSVIESYVDGGKLERTANDLILYGTINQTIGYVNIRALMGYSQEGDNRTEEEIFTEYVDAVLSEFQDMEALIVDIRLNGGGLDSAARAFAARFTDRKRLVYTKQVRVGGYDEFSELTPRYIEPEGVQFLNKPVVLLTSGRTASAADVLTMAMKELPDVTVMGETTCGIFSDILARFLPNGWMFGLSNERYFSSEGVNYEQKGIPPDMEIAGSEAALDEGRDNILDPALDALREGDACSLLKGPVDTLQCGTLNLLLSRQPAENVSGRLYIALELPEWEGLMWFRPSQDKAPPYVRLVKTTDGFLPDIAELVFEKGSGSGEPLRFEIGTLGMEGKTVVFQTLFLPDGAEFSEKNLQRIQRTEVRFLP